MTPEGWLALLLMAIIAVRVWFVWDALRDRDLDTMISTGKVALTCIGFLAVLAVT